MRNRLSGSNRLWYVAVAAWLCLASEAAFAAPYWIAYESDNAAGHFPEEEGWTRIWGNWDGQFHGTGAVRTLHDGMLTYDSLYDDGVYDFSQMLRPGQMDPDGPEERFVLEFRLRIDENHSFGGAGDQVISVTSDDAWVLAFEFTDDHIRSIFEDYVEVPYAPGVFHEYRVTSSDMRGYTLYIDGETAREGVFKPRFGTPRIGWGDSGQGSRSLADWGWFRFGVVVPEANSLWLLCLWSAWCVRRRGESH